MKIIPELFNYPFFTLLTAGVASGKTRMVVEFYQEQSFKIIYLSPLRALANEVYANLIKRKNKNVYLAGGTQKEGESLMETFEAFLNAKKSFLVTTPELLVDDFLEEIKRRKEKVVFVIDEFHLFYYWGESFRPILHDKFLFLMHLEFPVLAVTATMDKDIIEKMLADLAFNGDDWIHIDYGNHQLHRPPQKLISFNQLHSGYIERAFWRELRFKESKDIYLYFCSYRSQVDELVERSKRLGFRSVGCVGGEVQNFLDNCQNMNNEIDCIFSTTALSHGVNLPEIKKVFIGYEVKNYDFWLQMIGRGGRQGSEYEVYSCDRYHKNDRQCFLDKIRIWFWDVLGMETDFFNAGLMRCKPKLKALFYRKFPMTKGI